VGASTMISEQKRENDGTMRGMVLCPRMGS
jgi:hypothetical protein